LGMGAMVAKGRGRVKGRVRRKNHISNSVLEVKPANFPDQNSKELSEMTQWRCSICGAVMSDDQLVCTEHL
jgi:hypothetical protein